MRRVESSLVAPAIHVGRDEELQRLRIALDAAAAGECRVVLLAGPAGVGKTSLVQQLRPLASARGAWFVSGRFDQHSERETTAVLGALEALGTLLEARLKDEEDFVRVRGRILRTLGAHAGLARDIGGFSRLLADVPQARPVDPAHAAARMVEVVVGLLRAVVSPIQPLVFVLDDVQWSGAHAAKLIDSILVARDLSGLLLVAVCRDDALDHAEHPLAGALPRWKEAGSRFDHVQLANMQLADMSHLLSQILSVPAPLTLDLAQALLPHAAGNPCDTYELVTALHAEGLLPLGPDGIEWNEPAVRGYLARTGVQEALAARIALLLPPERHVLQVLACLGSRAGREVLRVAVPLEPPDFEAALRVLREVGMVEHQSSGDTLRLRHDRVQKAAYATLPEESRAHFHLALARRLELHAGFSLVAADQYVYAVDVLDGRPGQVRVARLLQQAAVQARQAGNPSTAARLLEAAIRLWGPAVAMGEAERSELTECEVQYHQVLYGTGHLQQADAVYARIVASGPGVRVLGEAACAQVISLTNRGRMDEAIALGLGALQKLGLSVPTSADTRMANPQRWERTRAWVAAFDPEHERTRPEATEPWVLAAAKIIDSMAAPAVFMNAQLMNWMIWKSQDLWRLYGACAPLACTLCRAGMTETASPEDVRIAHTAALQLLELCEARGWAPEEAQVRFHLLWTRGWFEPLERVMAESERAREALTMAGDLRKASFSRRVTALCLFDCGYSLHQFEDELETTVALARRAGNDQCLARCLVDRRMIRALSGRADDTAPQSAAALVSLQNGGPSARGWLDWYAAVTQAVVAAIFGNRAELAAHLQAAADSDNALMGFHALTWSRWLSGLSAAWRVASPQGSAQLQDPGDAWNSLTASIDWLDERARDEPDTFTHLSLHLQAERAWARGDWNAAAALFDQALDAADQVSRPWHQALIAERAGRMHQAQGWTFSGASLLGEARQRYTAWGATAKVAQLNAELGEPPLAEAAGTSATYHAAVKGDLVRMAALRVAEIVAIRAGPARLRACLDEALSGLVGATHVTLALWDEEAGAWVDADGQRAVEGVFGAAGDERHPFPMSVVRYVARAREILSVADALTDERFFSDPYLRGLQHASLLAAPVVQGGVLQAVLVLEDRTGHGSFVMKHLDAAVLIAGQAAGSLHTAMLYEDLERRVREQTRELSETQALLVEDARQAGMAQIAINVLHNMGNLLTSINVSVHVLAGRIRASRTARVGDLGDLIDAHVSDAVFFAPGGKADMMPQYAADLAKAFAAERSEWLAELEGMSASVQHIKHVVAMQQSYAKLAVGANDGSVTHRALIAP